MSGEQQVDLGLNDEWSWSDSHVLPDSVAVAVIGGGIVGCSAAYFLAREGLRVAVFEKGRIAGEQSGRNWGWVRQQGRSHVELPAVGLLSLCGFTQFTEGAFWSASTYIAGPHTSAATGVMNTGGNAAGFFAPVVGLMVDEWDGSRRSRADRPSRSSARACGC